MCETNKVETKDHKESYADTGCNECHCLTYHLSKLLLKPDVCIRLLQTTIKFIDVFK